MPEPTWTVTRSHLIDALAYLEVHPVLLSGRAAVNAESMADAILEQLPAAGTLEAKPPVRDLSSLALPGLTDAEADAFTEALAEDDGLATVSRTDLWLAVGALTVPAFTNAPLAALAGRLAAAAGPAGPGTGKEGEF